MNLSGTITNFIIPLLLISGSRFWEVDLDEEIHWKYNVTVYCVVPAILRSSDIYITIYVNWMYFFVYYAFPFVALVVFNVAIYRRVSR